jgi:hypothetical protein
MRSHLLRSIAPFISRWSSGLPSGRPGALSEPREVAILDEQVAQIGQSRFRPVRFPVQLGVRIRRGRMGVIRPRLAANVLAGTVGLSVFALKTLLSRPRFDQCAIDREVLVRHQPLRTVRHTLKEAASDRLVQQPVAILRNTVGSRTGSSFVRPTNHRNSRL